MHLSDSGRAGIQAIGRLFSIVGRRLFLNIDTGRSCNSLWAGGRRRVPHYCNAPISTKPLERAYVAREAPQPHKHPWCGRCWQLLSHSAAAQNGRLHIHKQGYNSYFGTCSASRILTCSSYIVIIYIILGHSYGAGNCMHFFLFFVLFLLLTTLDDKYCFTKLMPILPSLL